MKAAILDTSLSTTIKDVTIAVLPYTAEGSTMPTGTAQDIVIRLAKALKLASLMEQELLIHRVGEPNMAIREVLETSAAIVFDDLTRVVRPTVVKVDFGKGRKS